mmetsp:Transcript_4521/g.4236  ORF Transcript_4521/g.4236 Transcript_4521/m.4236 type:complete len:150 (+) Transcript_4521:185-634(+)
MIKAIKARFQLPSFSAILIEDGITDILGQQLYIWKGHIPSTVKYKVIKLVDSFMTTQHTFFVCQEKGCLKVTNKRGIIYEHLRFHTNEKPFRCPLVNCDLRYGQKYSMKYHFFSAHDRATYKCRVCFQKFFRKKRLFKHFQIHRDFFSS